ncbi:hypothetical protein CONPUDRAFT_105503 [Coniophora puteana RWD-64-598 SS2]|uniref:NACHT domain-containing protein n=1 Tax=Coniophora puteana (strain RWD-64-598) TaxID=741705 RepID=A0A5M3MN36_CONPW|nr:uncharacterized protein CONPUDRAFT_105503 [Coniophora puteana RWD-64-598 SS2]EIW80467.1 hypothetical protein CONPUDRAFT_105503 [Coniophora puteana RWD-64-598 SS2]
MACAQGAIYDSTERQPYPKCLPGTRTEFLESLRTTVHSEPPNIIWIVGDSGSGKSTVSHTLADELREEGLLAGTFFFSRYSPQRSTFGLVFLTLAYQLGLKHARAQAIITKAISDDPSLLDPAKSPRDQLEKLVIQVLEWFNVPGRWAGKNMSIILDALDEGISESKGVPAALIQPFIAHLVRLIRDSRLPIRNIIISSRPWPQIEYVMRNPDFGDILQIKPLGESANDVTKYLRHSFQQIRASHHTSLFRSGPWPPEEDIRMLSERSSGRFIFAATIIRQINQGEPHRRLALICGMLRGKVRRTWGDVHDLYKSIIDDIDEPTRKKGLYYLSLVVHLKRPLSLPTMDWLFGDHVQPYLIPFSALVSVPLPNSDGAVHVSEPHLDLSRYCLDALHEGRCLVDAYESGPSYVFDNFLTHLRQCKHSNDLQNLLADFLEDVFDGLLEKIRPLYPSCVTLSFVRKVKYGMKDIIENHEDLALRRNKNTSTYPANLWTVCQRRMDQAERKYPQAYLKLLIQKMSKIKKRKHIEVLRELSEVLTSMQAELERISVNKQRRDISDVRERRT